ncbi:MAG: DNA helicase [Bacteroidales bacterium]|nr:DNA helicase [Bacteroidales bacterium]
MKQPEVDDNPGPIKDLECERVVIASLVSSSYAMAECEPILDEDCFYHLHHQEIYKAIKRVYNSGDPISVITVNADLAKSGSTIAQDEVIKILMGTKVDYNPYYLAVRLKELSYRRRLWDIGINLITESSMEVCPVEGIHNDAKNRIDSLFDDLTNQVTTLTEAYHDVQEQMLINMNREPGAIRGTPTGFPWIDKNGGLTGTDLIIIGADTSQGKTSFATSVIINAIKSGEKIALYTLEMTPKQLGARIASMQSGIMSKKILNDKMELNDIYRVDAGMEQINMDNLFFDGRSTASLDSIMTSIRQLKKKHNIKGACVDYLQLVSVSDKTINREQIVAKIARDLKNLAVELDIWIIAISQLARGDKGNPKPYMSMLRDSGQIEEAADTVILLYRPEVYGRSYSAPYEHVSTSGTCLVDVVKGRNIGTGDFICGFKRENTLFYPLESNDPVFLGQETSSGSPISISRINGKMELEDLPF